MLSKLSQNISIHIQMYKVKIPHSKIKKKYENIKLWAHENIKNTMSWKIWLSKNYDYPKI